MTVENCFCGVKCYFDYILIYIYNDCVNYIMPLINHSHQIKLYYHSLPMIVLVWHSSYLYLNLLSWAVTNPAEVIFLLPALLCWYIVLIRDFGKSASSTMKNYDLCRDGLSQVIIYFVTTTWTVQAAWWAQNIPLQVWSRTSQVTLQTTWNSRDKPQVFLWVTSHQRQHNRRSWEKSQSQLSSCARSGPKTSISTSEGRETFGKF